MHAERRRIADRLYAEGRAHDDALADRRERFRNLEPATAELLGVLVRASGARRLLELGTSNGHSALWLADAAEATGGTLVSVEIDAARTELARAALRAARLAGRVELRVEDAATTLRESADGGWELVFLDAERPAYAGYVPDLVRTLAPGGMLAVDNAIFTAVLDAANECLGRFDSRPADDRWCDALLQVIHLAQLARLSAEG